MELLLDLAVHQRLVQLGDVRIGDLLGLVKVYIPPVGQPVKMHESRDSDVRRGNPDADQFP